MDPGCALRPKSGRSVRQRLLAPAVFGTVALICGGTSAQAHVLDVNSGAKSVSGSHIRVTLPADASFAGTQRWRLFGIADCKLFAFVRADRAKRVRQLYWMQFESYVASMPRLHHRYTSNRHAEFAGLNFYVDTWLEKNVSGPGAVDVGPLKAFIRSYGYAVPAAINSGSDEQHLDALLRKRGYALPVTLVAVRFVHLFDKEMRHELMIIYGEDGADTGLTPASTRIGGKAHDRWTEVERGLLRRAKKNLSIQRTSVGDN